MIKNIIRYSFFVIVPLFVSTMVAAEMSGHSMDMSGHHMKKVEGINIMLMLDPAPPKSKAKTSTKVTFMDHKTKKAASVSGVEIKWAMPDMGHDIATKKALPQREKGHFKSSIEFPMDGKYEATVTAKKGEKLIKAVFELVVGTQTGSDQQIDHSGMDHSDKPGMDKSDMGHGKHDH